MPKLAAQPLPHASKNVKKTNPANFELDELILAR